MHKIIGFLLLFLLLTTTIIAQKTSERSYAKRIAEKLGGELEVSVQSGRVDILNETHAIEVEFARKWKNSIGQALWYGLQTGKTPGIVLILEEDHKDYKYSVQLQSTLATFGLQDSVKVWLWPNDFEKLPRSQPNIPTTYWLTKVSKVRHNNTCTYFKKTRGRIGTNKEGRACKKCGG